MRWIDRNATIRITVLLLVCVTVVVVGDQLMTHCGAEPSGGFSSNLPAEGLAQLRERLKHHVHVLAVAIGQRSVLAPPSLRRTEGYIIGVWREQGYAVQRQESEFNKERVANLEVILRGTQWPEQVLLVGAHYDSVLGTPGADDNATGVAALLEISRRLMSVKPERTVRLVAFANEEPPFFQTTDMGSRIYARRAHARGEDILSMVSLETMGYYSESVDSQRYPQPFSFFYPDRGNFIAFVGNLSSRGFVRAAARAFRAHSDFPLECVTTFSKVPGVDWSDHGSFWEYGYQAMMVTDTALYRNPHYHTVSDTPEKLDYDALARVTDGLAAVVIDLARSGNR